MGKEPQTPLERDIAIMICRLNSWDTPVSNTPLTPEECESFREHGSRLREVWDAINSIKNEDHVAWMWNHGEHLWRPRPSLGKGGVERG